MLNLELLIARSLTLPRAVSGAMRDSIRANPTKALRFGSLVPHLTGQMLKAYKLGYRSNGSTLKQSTLKAVEKDYKRRAREVLTQYQKSTNRELKAAYAKAIRNGRTRSQAIRAVLAKFRSLGMSAPASTRMQTLYNTALNASHNQGIWDAQRSDPAIWGFRFKTMRDEAVRHPTHTQYEGVTLPKEHPFWDRVWPPLEWNCRCRIQTLKRKHKLKLPPSKEVRIPHGFKGQRFQLQ